MTKRTKTLIGGLILAAAVLVAVPALAHFGGGWGGYGGGHMMGQGFGYGGGNMMGPGWGGHMMGRGWGYGPGSGLDEAKAKELYEARQKLYDDTRDLRRNLFTKQQEIEALLANPDSTKEDLVAKQKEINELTNQLSEKHLTFRRDLEKQFPELDDDYGRPMGGRGYGRFNRGPGSCWF